MSVYGEGYNSKGNFIFLAIVNDQSISFLDKIRLLMVADQIKEEGKMRNIVLSNLTVIWIKQMGDKL